MNGYEGSAADILISRRYKYSSRLFICPVNRYRFSLKQCSTHLQVEATTVEVISIKHNFMTNKFILTYITLDNLEINVQTQIHLWTGKKYSKLIYFLIHRKIINIIRKPWTDASMFVIVNCCQMFI